MTNNVETVFEFVTWGSRAALVQSSDGHVWFDRATRRATLPPSQVFELGQDSGIVFTVPQTCQLWCFLFLQSSMVTFFFFFSRLWCFLLLQSSMVTFFFFFSRLWSLSSSSSVVYGHFLHLLQSSMVTFFIFFSRLWCFLFLQSSVLLSSSSRLYQFSVMLTSSVCL